MNTAQKKELDKRYLDYQKGIGKTHTWDETVVIAEKALIERRAFFRISRNSKEKFKKR